jgi:hypothetical protein
MLAALATLASARVFYGYLRQQTGGEWSAPLDDVFIHFDYARATARGYPFQWSEGNGYSSGNTSLLYPFALAIGYWAGFRDQAMMVWAAIVAMVSTFGFLWGASRLFRFLPRLTTVLAPAAIFSVGALGWTLWSGMEVAFFLGLWGAAALVAIDVADGRLSWRPGALGLGALGVLLVTTRPEAATSMLVLGLYVAGHVAHRHGVKQAFSAAIRAGGPAIGALAVQAIANRLLTGESAANGAIVKLALYNPYLTPDQKLGEWKFILDYAVDRMTLHHFGEPIVTGPGPKDRLAWGWIPVWLALVPFADRRTRGAATLLWSSAILWVLLVALNGQARWQNERYLMPAVAWVLLAAALGVAVLIAPAWRIRWRRRLHAAVGAAVAVAALLTWWKVERVQYRDQIWFFGRASRNIRDQHITAGRMLRALDPQPNRVMVGDAGALLYASDLPGFDLIGLGGYRDLPLARAGVHGIAATLELIERMKPADRPEIMAIYATWWPALPTWFGQRLFGVTVRGNVICGGAEKVILRADWHLLGTGNLPRTMAPSEMVLDEVDVADLVSEREHRYVFPQPEGGYAEMRVLDDGTGRDLWDAGRRIPLGRTETMRIGKLEPGRGARLVLRTVVDRASAIDVQVGAITKRIDLPVTKGWKEISIELPGDAIKTTEADVAITPRGGEWVGFHLWVVSRK